MTTTRISMLPSMCGLLASLVLAAPALAGGDVKHLPLEIPPLCYGGRLDVEEVYQFDEGRGPGGRPRVVRVGEDVLIFDFGDEGRPGGGEGEREAGEWRRP